MVHRRIFALLHVLGIRTPLLNLISGMFADLITTELYGGCELDSIHIASGIKQGCPTSGSIFAPDPLVRAYLAVVTFQISRIGVFAEEIASALQHFDRDVHVVLSLFRHWRGSSGLELEVERCSAVMGTRAVDRYRDALEQREDAKHMQFTMQVAYLGISVGPDEPAYQWQAVVSAPRITGRTLLFTAHYSLVSSLSMHNAHFVHLSADILRSYAQQRASPKRFGYGDPKSGILGHPHVNT